MRLVRRRLCSASGVGLRRACWDVSLPKRGLTRVVTSGRALWCVLARYSRGGEVPLSQGGLLLRVWITRQAVSAGVELPLQVAAQARRNLSEFITGIERCASYSGGVESVVVVDELALLLAQPTLGVEGCHAAGAGGGDRLAVVKVSHIP